MIFEYSDRLLELQDIDLLREVRPGAFYLPGFFDREEQQELIEMCRLLKYYHPPAPFGRLQKKTKACLGRKVNVPYRVSSDGSKYEETPSVPPVTQEWKELASRIAAKVDMTIDADLLVVNRYPEGTGFGVHMDDDERPESIEKGIPVVSISLGDDADFRFGGLNKNNRYEEIRFHSGDAFVFGGPSRLCWHGIARIYAGTGPKDLVRFDDGFEGRVNITLRQY